jgi:hypothetical protein
VTKRSLLANKLFVHKLGEKQSLKALCLAIHWNWIKLANTLLKTDTFVQKIVNYDRGLQPPDVGATLVFTYTFCMESESQRDDMKRRVKAVPAFYELIQNYKLTRTYG